MYIKVGLFMLVCLSVSYKHASVPVLESLTLQDKGAFVQALCSEKIAQECVLIQTCHRVEIYCKLNTPDRDEAIKQILKKWSTITGVSSDIIAKLAQLYYEKKAMEHLFYLTSGLESMVLGEDQIIGQVRKAFLAARKHGSTGQLLDKVFMKALNTGKLVRTRTKINEGSVSISSAAVDLASNKLGDLKSKKVLIIGAGEAGTLAAEALKSYGVPAMTITNRTFKKSQVLAEKVSGFAIPFSDVLAAICHADLVITAISVKAPLFTEQELISFMTDPPRSKQALMIDISQPRAIEEEVGLLDGICLKTIDDLKQIVDQTLRNRTIEAEKAKVIVSEELSRFEIELSKLVAQPLINEIFKRYEEIRLKELTRAIRKMGISDKEKLAIIERFSRELIERVAQIPIEQLRAAALSSDNGLLEAAERLFQTKTERTVF
ncbi:MAG: glutamyl-tRNA reductase [Candidatus Bathyarchaeia archaeon]|jgi:glutamyl-tRNA reductase